MKKQLLALTAAITTVSALSSTPSAQAEIGYRGTSDMTDDEEIYVELLVAASEVWSGIPHWDFWTSHEEWIARGKEACRKADNGTPLLTQFQEAKRKGDTKTMLAINSALQGLCERHGSLSLMKRTGTYLGNL